MKDRDLREMTILLGVIIGCGVGLIAAGTVDQLGGNFGQDFGSFFLVGGASLPLTWFGLYHCFRWATPCE